MPENRGIENPEQQCQGEKSGSLHFPTLGDLTLFTKIGASFRRWGFGPFPGGAFFSHGGRSLGDGRVLLQNTHENDRPHRAISAVDWRPCSTSLKVLRETLPGWDDQEK
jgi:hypothetical protein